MNPLVKIPARYGIAGVIIQGALFLVLYFIGENPLVGRTSWDFGFVMIPLMVFFGMKDFKVNHNRGELRFWQGMTSGFVIYGIIAVGSAFFIWNFLTWADPTVLDAYIADRIQMIIDKKEQIETVMGPEIYQDQLIKMENTKAWVVAVDDFWKKLSIGLFLTIIIAVLLRR